MNSTTGIMPFGMLTAKALQTSKFEELDLNLDGFVTEDEIISIFGKKIFDTVELSSIDKDADKKVTQSEYELWQQEAQIKELTDMFKTQASKDMVGQDNDTILSVINQIEEFKNYFITSYPKQDNILKMAYEFKKELPIKYMELRKNAMKNAKSEIKSQVIEAVIEEVINDSKKGGRTYTGLINNQSFTLSENARRILGNELSKEADKFIKNFDGEELEHELKEHLLTFLRQSDRSKLADQINIWENSKKALADLPKEVAFRQLKDAAKDFLTALLEAGIYVNIKNLNIRTNIAITAILGQFKDYEDLKNEIDLVIRNLSSTTVLDKIKFTQPAAIKESLSKIKREESKK